ncbi:GHKL domain-containing protein [Mucilaginibacter sp. Bleaf8]|uniref:sensor histidine kinase n=1 Tax=Mucilaginibacter sp. Bleaf8 TaxID=2834430 RepID=UPI001BCF0BDA|nr:ATP-binding protein [Mucilaginibacter sp. Bleaf8]MBS7566596.1 GHKL domain-containing protein [Mucilaginibacter sp. Bleaf8]
MTTFAKIRLLLAMLFASLLLTSVIIHYKNTPKYSFINAARTLENNLHKKETLAGKVLSDPQFEQLKMLDKNERAALNIIETYTQKQRLWIITLKNNQLAFWSGIKVLPDNYLVVKEGRSFIKQSNGYYEAIKKTRGSFSAIAFIPVKNAYQFQNTYLQNNIDRDLLQGTNLDIADFSDKDVYHIHDISNRYLFSVKATGNAPRHAFSSTEIVCWVLTLIALCLLIDNFCNYLAHKKRLLAAFGTLALSIIIIRFINIYFHFPDFDRGLQIFNPAFYTLNSLFPSLGDMLLNLLAACWLVAFIYSHRYKIVKRNLGKPVSYIIFIGGVLFMVLSSTVLFYLFKRLVADSNISFDVNNVLNLTSYSALGVLMACLSFLAFYLLAEIMLAIDSRLAINSKAKLAIFISLILLATGIHYVFEFTEFYLLWGAIVLGCAYADRYKSGTINAISYVIVIFTSALIFSLNLNSFQAQKEREVRKQLVKELENGNSHGIKQAFSTVEHQLIHDPVLLSYFTRTESSPNYLKDRLQKFYFDGYLSDYEFKIHPFNSQGQPLFENKDYTLNDFKDMVIYSSFKVSEFFYRENESFGFQKYFAILPVYQGESNLGTLIIELKSKPFHSSDSFPEILVDNRFSLSNEFKDYAYAFYSDGHLLTQNGKFDYNVINNEFKGNLKQYVFKTTQETNPSKPWWQRLNKYSHLIYQPSLRKVIVVTRQESNLLNSVASLTFFFVVLLAFSASLIILKWIWARLTIVKVTRNSIRWNFALDLDRILYKTRIQFSMIFAVVVTLALVGIITFLSIKDQYQDQQDEAISEKVTRIADKLENNFTGSIQDPDEEAQVEFNSIAADFSTDLSLFDSRGRLLFSSQPKIYSFGILKRYMNAKAYVMLSRLQKSVFVNDEKVGTLNYKSAYAPIRNNKNVTVAYLQLPSFSDEAEYRDRIGTFLNDLINIYALIFIAIGLFAVVVARQITTPLSFIQQNLSKTVYGKKIEPIKWRRDDEIGALVTEYNKMIAALENSASRLAQSERESAWREMAKQVAHEIKNPLTPLKLGLQLLEKSWKDKDPKFDLKFERFNKSFVEQIESLSSIASEFSAFAKMPDTRMEKLDVFETLGQAIIIFKHMDNITIAFNRPEQPYFIKADRDQLLRCFNNLLKNAIEAMSPDRMGLIEVTYILSTNQVLINIKDNGNGIPENLRTKIFEPNFTTKSSGTGLGLAFVKNSIENAGGKVWFETEIGHGTTFHLNFPVSRL